MKNEYINLNGTIVPAPVPTERPLPFFSKYKDLRLRYLEENQPALLSALMLEGALQAHLEEVDAAAREAVGISVSRMSKAQGVTEERKRADPLGWAAQMNNIKNAAEEAVLPGILWPEAKEKNGAADFQNQTRV